MVLFPVTVLPFRLSAKHQEFVRRVNALFRVRLRMSVVVASRWCERLTQVVLGKAFRGEVMTAACIKYPMVPSKGKQTIRYYLIHHHIGSI